MSEPTIAAPAPQWRSMAVPSWNVQAAAILAFSVYLHSLFWWTPPRDMELFLGPWFDHLVRYGPVGAFAHPFSNYTPAYLYLLALASTAHGLLAPVSLIKLLSVAGTLLLAFAVRDLLKSVGAQARYALLVFALPSVVINAALLAQCDALWSGACIFAVATMIRGQAVRSLVWCGVALAFKAQAAFIAPLIVGAMIGRRAPLWQWAIPGLVFLATLVPPLLMGWPARDLLLVYPNQAGWAEWPGRLANPWIAATIFAPDAAKAYYVLGYASALAAGAGMAWLASGAYRNPRVMLALAALSATLLPFLLPKVLERYYFLADVLALILALACRSRSSWFAAIAIQSASLLSLLTYMYWYARPYPTLAGAFLAAAGIAAMWVTAKQEGLVGPASRAFRGA